MGRKGRKSSDELGTRGRKTWAETKAGTINTRILKVLNSIAKAIPATEHKPISENLQVAIKALEQVSTYLAVEMVDFKPTRGGRVPKFVVGTMVMVKPDKRGAGKTNPALWTGGQSEYTKDMAAPAQIIRIAEDENGRARMARLKFSSGHEDSFAVNQLNKAG